MGEAEADDAVFGAGEEGIGEARGDGFGDDVDEGALHAGEATGHEFHHGEAESGGLLEEVGEVFPGDGDGDGFVDGLGGGGAFAVFDDGAVADDISFAGDVEDDFFAVIGNLVDFDAAFEDEVDALGWVAGGEDDLAGLEAAFGEVGDEAFELFVGEDVEDAGELPEVPGDGALEGFAAAWLGVSGGWFGDHRDSPMLR